MSNISNGKFRQSVLLALLLLFSIRTQAQGYTTLWADKTDGSAPESCMGAVMDLATNIYVVGHYFDYTNIIGNVTLTNILASSNLFLATFQGIHQSKPAWAKTVVTEYPISLAKDAADTFGNISLLAGSFGGTNLAIDDMTLTNYGATGSHTEDIFIASFFNDGTLHSLTQLGGAGEDTFGDLLFDPNGFENFYVTGSFQSTNFNVGSTTLTRISTNTSDCFTAKFDGNGDLLWLKQASYAAGQKLYCDNYENCYVAGKILGSSTFDGLAPSNHITDNFLAQYDGDGNLIWVRGDMPPIKQMTFTTAFLELKPLYVAGTFSNTLQIGSIILSNSAPSTIYIAKLDTNGTPIWARQLPGGGYDDVQGLQGDDADECWLVGSFASSPQTNGFPSNSTAIVACYNSEGVLAGFDQAGGPPMSTASAVSGNANVNMCIAGTYRTNFFLDSNYPVTNSGNSDIYVTINEFFPSLHLAVNGNKVVVTWPAANSTFAVQTLTNLSGDWSTLGSGVSQNGQSSLTNTANSNVKFFRLMQQP